MSTRSIRKVGASAALGVAGLVAGGVLAGSMTANAATTTPSYGSAPAQSASQDTPVTGTAADKVKAAVKAKHAGTTITTVQQDPDGSYDALGTDSTGNAVAYDVSKDLATITARIGGGHGGGPRGSQDAAVTGTEAANVKAAVVATHAGTTITEVRKDPDGSYDALGTDNSGNRVFYDVSKDLKTITAGGGGDGGPGGGQPPASGTTQSG